MKRASSTVAAALLAGLLVAVLWLDLCRPAREQWSAAALLAAIDTYQTHVSPGMAAAGIRCRFEPSCSVYAESVIRQQGALIGGLRAAARVARCGPWIPAGTVDQP